MKNLLSAAGLAGLLGLTGCAVVGAPVVGSIYTDVKYPSYYHGVEASGPAMKTGTAQAASILGIVATGDASVAAACRNGGIKKISTIDTHATNILGLYATWTTVVTGE